MIERNSQARMKLKEGVDLIADIVKDTLGPKGKNVILFENGKAFTTKDGISIASRVYSDDKAVEAGIQLAREASEKTAKLAGDGSTTSLILTQAFFNTGLKLLEAGESILEVKRRFDEVGEWVKDNLQFYVRPCAFNEKTIKKVATTSANNDETIGNLVTEAFVASGENGTVTFEASDTPQSFVETIEGSRYPLAIAAKEFFTSQGRQEACYDNPEILLLANEVKNITQLKPVLEYIVKERKAIVIFATDFSPLALNQLYKNYVQGLLNVVPIKITGYAGNRTDTLHDLKALTGANVYDVVPQVGGIKLGVCDKIVSTLQSITLLKREPTENYEIRINNLKEMIANEKDDTVRAFMEQRLTNLKGKISIIHVGGKTEVEAKERYDRVEDAVCAVKSALEEGICVGGGYTYNVLCELHDKNVNPQLHYLLSCLGTPYTQLLANSGFDVETAPKFSYTTYYNFLTDTFESIDNPNVIDAAKVVRLSIENALSVSLMLLTTESIIYVE